MVKKNYFLFYSLLLATVMFTACNDDNKTIEEEVPVSAIVSKWEMSKPVTNENGVYVSNGPIAFNWEAPEGTTVLDMPLDVFTNWVENLGSVLLPQVLKDITLQEDGNIVATFSREGVSMTGEPVTPIWVQSEPKFAKFSPNGDNQILLFLNLNEIMNTMSRVDATDLLPILSLVEKGIPFHYEMSADKSTVRFYLDKSVMDLLMPLLALVKTMELPDMGGVEALLPVIIAQIEEAYKVTTKFELGLRLTK